MNDPTLVVDRRKEERKINKLFVQHFFEVSLVSIHYKKLSKNYNVFWTLNFWSWFTKLRFWKVELIKSFWYKMKYKKKSKIVNDIDKFILYRLRQPYRKNLWISIKHYYFMYYRFSISIFDKAVPQWTVKNNIFQNFKFFFWNTAHNVLTMGKLLSDEGFS